MPAGEAARWLQAGRVGRPHGLDGSFHVLEPSAGLLAQGAKVVVAGRERVVDRRAGSDQRPIVHLAGDADRAAAESLRGQQLLAARSLAPELEEDEWWAEDLEGCEVRDGVRRVGVVSKLLALPSVDVLEVTRDDGRGQLLVPLVADAVRAVDVERKEIEIDLAFLGED